MSNYYYYTIFEFFTPDYNQFEPVIFHWNLSDSKSPQLFGTLLSFRCAVELWF